MKTPTISKIAICEDLLFSIAIFADLTVIWPQFDIFADPAKKRSSNFLCSIICCLGKRSSKHKNKDKEVSANANTGDVIDSGNAKPSKAPQKALLPDLRPEEADKKCIVIDLDETLVHSSFKVRLILYN